MDQTLWGFPIWFIMAVIAALVIPTSYSIFKHGIKAKIDTKLGSAGIDAADDDPDPEQVQNDKQD